MNRFGYLLYKGQQGIIITHFFAEYAREESADSEYNQLLE